MKSEAIEELYDTYKRVKECHVNKEQFGTMVLFFPALLVVACDGEIDEEEWVYVRYLAKFIADSFKTEIPDDAQRAVLQENFSKELEFLAHSLDEWKAKFVAALKNYLVENPLVKDDVEDILHLFAEASEGESEEEAETIMKLEKELGLKKGK